MKTLIVVAALACPALAFAQADLSGVWNKRLVVNTSAGVEPLPFTPEGLKAFNDVWNRIDPTSRCIFPGVPRVNTSPYPMQIVQAAGKVIFLYEYMHNFRVIYTDGRTHRASWEPSLCRSPWSSSQVRSVMLTVSMTSVSPSHFPIESPISDGSQAARCVRPSV